MRVHFFLLQPNLFWEAVKAKKSSYEELVSASFVLSFFLSPHNICNLEKSHKPTECEFTSLLLSTVILLQVFRFWAKQITWSSVLIQTCNGDALLYSVISIKINAFSCQ